MKGKIYLLPCPIAEDALDTIPPRTAEITRSLTYFVAERARTARRYLKILGMPVAIQELQVEEMEENISKKQIESWLDPVLKGKDLGILSEAGCPGVADPGADFVKMAHQKGIQVISLVGPSSILLALMSSGLNGQSFCFHGYLPSKQELIQGALKDIEKASLTDNQTQVFIETPYRNNQILGACLKYLSPDMRLCIAMNLTATDEWVQTKSIKDWRQFSNLTLDKKPAIFLLGM